MGQEVNTSQSLLACILNGLSLVGFESIGFELGEELHVGMGNIGMTDGCSWPTRHGCIQRQTAPL